MIHTRSKYSQTRLRQLKNDLERKKLKQQEGMGGKKVDCFRNRSNLTDEKAMRKH